jgi:hypothetical protein
LPEPVSTRVRDFLARSCSYQTRLDVAPRLIHARARDRVTVRSVGDGWTVLPRATTRVRERVQASANPAPRRERKRLQIVENTRTIANERIAGCQLDKLGVTGSSPVPPIFRCRFDNVLWDAPEAVRVARRLVLDSTRGDLPGVRQGASGRVPVLPFLRGASSRCPWAGAAEDGDGRVLRRHRLDGVG